MEIKHNCDECSKRLEVGKDALKLVKGVMGLKGFIPSDKVMYFCSEDCLESYYDVRGLPSLPSRIP